MRVGLVQLATEVGNLAGNARAIRAGVEAARAAGAEVAVVPELAVTGYPPLVESALLGLSADHREPFDYAVVSPLVDELVENRTSRAALVAKGYAPAIVDDCAARIRRAEYKRRQAPPGIKVTGKAFGVGRRMPIAHPFEAR